MASKVPVCPFCESTDWLARSRGEEYNYKGQRFVLDDVVYSECTGCGFEVVLPKQAKNNECRVRDEHRKIDGLLTGSEIRAIRKSLELTQARAAVLLGGGVNAFSRYERGEITQTSAMDSLLRVLHAIPAALEIVSARRAISHGIVHTEVSSYFEDDPIPRATQRTKVTQVRDYRALEEAA